MKNEFAGKFLVATVDTNERKPGTYGRKVLGRIIRAGAAGIAAEALKADPNGNLNNHIRWDVARGRVKVLSRAPRAAKSA